MIKFENICIRAIEKTDLKLLQEWRNDESLRRYFREYREFSTMQKENWYEKMICDHRFEMFMIVDQKTDEPVGATGFTYIDWVNRHCDLHFYIGKNSAWIDEQYSPSAFRLMLHRGFNHLNMNKIWAEIYEIDSKKKIFFQNQGFSVDARLRNHYYYDGKYHDSFILSMLEEEYEKGNDNSCAPG